MSIEKWSEIVRIAHLSEDPLFTDDLDELETQVRSPMPGTVILDLANVHVINSSNLAKLLKLRVLLSRRDGRLILCCVPKQVWNTFQATGLDHLFDFSESVSAAVTSVQ
jgi:anti-anti-sigma factor